MEVIKRGILWEIILIMLTITINGAVTQLRQTSSTEKKEYIKWMEFTPTYEALTLAYQTDISTKESDNHIDWIELLAYTAAKTGGNFSNKSLTIMRKGIKEITDDHLTIQDMTKDLKYFGFYHEAYHAVLAGMVGNYEAETIDENGKAGITAKYGLKAFHPIAKNFPYSDYDDFGSSRSYGYKRRHLGHDMMGQTGTPIIAIESGTVEAIGWNRYGGWRLGIRSFDKKRYYYYAHLRQNYPYQSNLEEGSLVTAGDVIGYMGHTGYSSKENVNNIKQTHLHWGLQIIFDESQKESDNEIWIDCYQLTKFLYQNRSETRKKEGTKEWERIYHMRDPEVEKNRKEISVNSFF